MHAEELAHYEVPPEDFWDELEVRCSDGYNRADMAEAYNWRVVNGWGQEESHILGNHPYVMVFFREQCQPNGAPTTWEVVINVEGDTTMYRCPSEEIRTQITDYLHWYHARMVGCEWVQGIEDVDHLPEKWRGPAARERIFSEIQQLVTLPDPFGYPSGELWDRCFRSVEEDMSNTRLFFPQYSHDTWNSFRLRLALQRYLAQTS